MAAHLSDRTNVYRTTFLRSAKYKALLVIHIRSQLGAAALVDDGTDDPYILKAKLASFQAEAGTLRFELKRISAQLCRHEARQQLSNATKSDVDFANLCVLLCEVRADTFAIDAESRTLLDMAARPSERLVSSVDRTAAFVGWVEQNSSLPLVEKIRRG